MRLTKQQSDANREKIVETASYQFRQHGFDGIGLTDLMKSAGFSHGGFYNHFDSKDSLIEEACRASFDEYTSRLAALLGEDPSLFVVALQKYLSIGHRDDPGKGCPTASLVGDAQNQTAQVQSAFADGINRYLEIFKKTLSIAEKRAEEHPQASAEDIRAKSMRVLSEIVGAMLLSRSVLKSDPGLSEEILKASRDGIG